MKFAMSLLVGSRDGQRERLGVMSPTALVASDMAVNALSVAMILTGVVLFVVTVRFWRSAGEDPEVLAPLEVMGDRRFARAGEEERLGILNSVRPEGAQPIDHVEAPAVLEHEPAQQRRPFRDRFDHRDDAVDVVGPVDADDAGARSAAVPPVIDPLLSQQQREPERGD
jgi:hypothetical protein